MFAHSRQRLTLRSLLVIPTISTFVLNSLPVSAYIPAVAVNDTSGLNFTDSSTIAISWTDPKGTYSGLVSFQLQADVRTGGTTSGALVHFSESNMGANLTTSTPWIAYISCDVNETTWSDEWDIFTLARDRGAVSALLYTSKAQSCLLNQEYITDFEKPLDVFATKTVQVARLIDNQFVHTNDSFNDYNGTLLNISGTDVNNSLAGDAPTFKTFLMGTLTARNSTGQATATTIPNAEPSSSGSGSGGNKKTSAPMIVLYTITGVVSSMFLAMLIMGARRAMLHPERYGRREGDDEQGPQSTAGGLAQAILDTFPVIKYNRNNERFAGAGTGTDRDGTSPKRLSSENNLETIGLNSVRHSHTDVEAGHGDGGRRRSGTAETYAESSKSVLGGGVGISGDASGGLASRASGSGYDGTGSVDAGGDDTMVDGQHCPICLVDFEAGDDLRVLPCEREHVYHQSCIDPWLLQVSSSCPLCRKDFNAPQSSSIASTSAQTPPNDTSSTSSPHSSQYASEAIQPPTQPPTQHGFARYLAFVRRQRRHTNTNSGSTAESEGESNGGSGRRSRTRYRGNGGAEREHGVGPGRRREADQTGPGGY
ncbi:hypothetical protein I317_03445 [Kwoniella heveanensis CBS 569]|nr:hypothetical protein I317_03445 [Kwoniella heveanensis CBS 569]